MHRVVEHVVAGNELLLILVCWNILLVAIFQELWNECCISLVEFASSVKSSLSGRLSVKCRPLSGVIVF